MRFAAGVLITLALLWLVFVAALLVVRPRGMDLREARRIVPDTVRLLRALHGDATLPPAVRRWLSGLLLYLAFPIDLVPDFVPVLGYADDVIVVAFVLRHVVRLAGPAAIERHWVGTPTGLTAIRRLAGITD